MKTHRERMGRVDAAWLHMDRPENTADIVSLVELDGPLSLARLTRLLQARLVARFPRFRQRIVEDPPFGTYWERDPRFALRRHVVERTLAATDDAAVARVVSEIATEPLPEDHPPWRAVLLDRGGRASVVVKLHHCVADGFALMAVLLGLSDEHGAHPTPPAEAAPGSDGLSAALARVLPEAAAIAGAPLASALSLWKMVTLDPAHGPLGGRELSGVRRVAWSSGWPLRDVRAAARAAGVTINDLILAALSGALRRRLLAVHPLTEPADLRALVPVNLRPRIPGDTPETLGNRFGLVFAELPVGTADAAGRLEAVHDRMVALRQGPDAMVTLAVLGALGLVPGPVERLGTAFFSRKASLVVTNVPGPKRRLHLGGRRIARMAFWVPHPSTLGLGVSLFTYGGEVTVGVRADAAVLPDPALLVDDFEAELARLAPRAPTASRLNDEAPAALARPGPEAWRPAVADLEAATSPAS